MPIKINSLLLIASLLFFIQHQCHIDEHHEQSTQHQCTLCQNAVDDSHHQLHVSAPKKARYFEVTFNIGNKVAKRSIRYLYAINRAPPHIG